MSRKAEVNIGRIGVDSPLFSELTPLPPLLYFTSCMGFFLEVQILTLDPAVDGVMYVELTQSQNVIMVA